MTILQNYIAELQGRAEELKAELHLIEETVKSIRKICKHTYEAAGSDSHYTHYKCTQCGEEYDA